jgi:hypothetical protein
MRGDHAKVLRRYTVDRVSIIRVRICRTMFPSFSVDIIRYVTYQSSRIKGEHALQSGLINIYYLSLQPISGPRLALEPP